MHLELRREWIILNIGDTTGKPGLEIGMGLKEPASLSKEALRIYDVEHYSPSPSFDGFQKLVGGLKIFHPARIDIFMRCFDAGVISFLLGCYQSLIALFAHDHIFGLIVAYNVHITPVDHVIHSGKPPALYILCWYSIHFTSP